MLSKHVHFYPGIDFHKKDRGTQKIKIWKISPKTYYTDNHAYKKQLASHPDKRKSPSVTAERLFLFRHLESILAAICFILYTTTCNEQPATSNQQPATNTPQPCTVFIHIGFSLTIFR
jgi:hypothetical protein